MRILSNATAFFLVLLLASAAGATTYYVDQATGNDADDGLTLGNAWATISHACSTLTAGDTALIRAGTYDRTSDGYVDSYHSGWHTILRPLNNGSSGNPIVFKNYPGDERPVIKGDTLGRPPNTSCFDLGGRSWFVLDSLRLSWAYGFGVNIQAASNIVIQNCYFDTIGYHYWSSNNNAAAISAETENNTNHITIDNCEFKDNNLGFGLGGSSGINIYDYDSLVIKNCLTNGSDVYLKNGTVGTADKVHLYDNVFNSPVALPPFGRAINVYCHHNVFSGVASQGLLDVLGGTDCANNFVRGNWYVYNNTLDCRLLTNDRAINSVQYEHVYDIDTATITASPSIYALRSTALTQGDEFWNQGYVTFLNGAAAGETSEVIAFTAAVDSLRFSTLSTAPSIGDSFVVFRGDSVYNINIFNNLTAFVPSGSYSMRFMNKSDACACNSATPDLLDTSRFYVDYNYYYNPGRTDQFEYGRNTGTCTGSLQYYTFGEWQDTVVKFDVNGTNGSDPLFVDTSTGDYNLAPGSPAATAGVGGVVGVITAPSYVGAFEPGPVCDTLDGMSFYVDQATGNNSWHGKCLDSAWKTISHACSTITAGQTVYIRAGTYDSASEGRVISYGGGYSIVRLTHSGTSGNPITIRNYPGDARPILRGSNDTTTGAGRMSCLEIGPYNWVVVDSLHFVAGFKSGIAIQGCDDIVIQNCRFDSIGAHYQSTPPGHQNPAAIFAETENGNDRNFILNNYFFDNDLGYGAGSSLGIVIYDPDSLVVAGNTFDQSTMYLKNGSVGTARNVHVYNNTVFGGMLSLLPFGTAVGVYCHHNVLWDCGGQGCIEVISDVDCGDKFVRGDYYVYNNTMDMEGAFRSGLSNVQYEYNATDSMYNINMFNNLTYSGGSWTNNVHTAIRWYGKSDECGCSGIPKKTDTSRVWIDNNFYYIPAATDKAFQMGRTTAGDCTGSVENLTFAQWQDTIVKFDVHGSWGTDPQFVNATIHDYRLQAGSPAATAGADSMIKGVILAPAYVGAFAPSDTTCPTVTLAGPGDDTTIAQTQIDLEANFTTDGAGDDIIVTLYGEKSDATPDVLLFTDTLTADSAGWTYNWASLTEDSTYYWQIIATDTSCADTSPVRSFLVDSIPPPTALVPSIGAGTNFQGVYR